MQPADQEEGFIAIFLVRELNHVAARKHQVKDPEQIVSHHALYLDLIITDLLDTLLSLLWARAETPPCLLHLSSLLLHVFDDHVNVAPAIELALARFAEFRALQEEVGNLTEALETRKKVEKAKGILMDTQGMSEAEAFRKIQKMSMNTRKPMKEVAEAIILANSE